VFVLFAGSIWRFRSNRYSYSALSSQFLEDRQLLWGTIAWHVGILVILLGHVVGLGFPSVWLALMNNQALLVGVEVAGVAFTILAIFGLVALLVRRTTSGRLQLVSTSMDFVVLGLLLVQILLGLWVALGNRWGAVWGPAALSPYLWSLITLQPNLDYVVNMPGVVKLHLVGAWLLLLVIPFSRLVHIFSLPLHYLWRSPQVVVWTNARRFMGLQHRLEEVEDRRAFMKAGIGLTAGGALLTVGTADKLVRYLKGPEMDELEEAKMLQKKLDRLNQTAEQRSLELERLRSPFIEVARLSELDAKKGKYFIDYQMAPALAFLGADGLPLLISAKCTHLGCTVGSDLDGEGRILCPCHVSYFSIRTGMPNPGAPAKAPLPRLAWILKDAEGKTLLSESASGQREGSTDVDLLRDAIVYIAKSPIEGARS
jgi:nitrate reductase gamma subunit